MGNCSGLRFDVLEFTVIIPAVLPTAFGVNVTVTGIDEFKGIVLKAYVAENEVLFEIKSPTLIGTFPKLAIVKVAVADVPMAVDSNE